MLDSGIPRCARGFSGFRPFIRYRLERRGSIDVNARKGEEPVMLLEMSSRTQVTSNSRPELPVTDVISDVLEHVRLQVLDCEVPICAHPWSISASAGTPRFYAVLQGNCRLCFAGSAPVLLGPGDLAIVTQGEAHALHQSDCSVASPSQMTPLGTNTGFIVSRGEGERTARIVCGSFTIENESRLPFLSALPAVLHVRDRDSGSAGWLSEAARVLLTETNSRLPGARTIANGMLRVLLVQAMRGSLTNSASEGNAWLHSAFDPDIGRVVKLIHQELSVPWTVASLAEKADMSRSSFAARFLEVVGMPPLHYVAQCRMRQASELLYIGSLGTKEIAARVGYRSQAAFRTAYKRWAGSAPGAVRKRRV